MYAPLPQSLQRHPLGTSSHLWSRLYFLGLRTLPVPGSLSPLGTRSQFFQVWPMVLYTILALLIMGSIKEVAASPLGITA